MNPATFVAGSIVGACAAVSWALFGIHPPHHNNGWDSLLLVAVPCSLAMVIGVIALLADGVKRG